MDFQTMKRRIHMKKAIAMILAALLCVTLLAGCGGKPSDTGSAGTKTGDSTGSSGLGKSTEDLLHEKYENPVKLKVVLGYRDSEDPETPDSVTPETATAVKRFKEELNIELEYSWIVNSDQYEAKFGAELAAGNLPDVMMLTPNQFEDLYSQGGLGDLTETYNLYVNEGIKNIVNFDDQLINAGTRDGKIYGLPMATYPGQVTSQTFYDMSKLKDAGITTYDQLPKTITEFEALCDKLLTLDLDGNGKTGDPVIPANKYYIDSGLADFSPVFHAYESWAGGWYDDGSGKLVNAGIQPELKDSLTKLNEWYNKGYFAKDFAALDVWAADSPVVSDIVAGKYAIVLGSWWIPNWPLNDNKKNNPDADWVVGPTLTEDGSQPTILVPRYPVNNFVAVSRDCKNPEAVFKMMNWSLEYAKETSNPEWRSKATEEQLLEMHSEVYIWLPYRVYSPSSLIENYEFLKAKREANETTIDPAEAPNNNEFWGAWNAFVKHNDGTEDASTWGLYLSRIDPNGGVAKMYDLYTNADKKYNEVYVTTPSMITKQGEMDKYRDSTFLSMIMGETPITEFEKYVSEWKNLGGNDIEKEVNEWYKNK
jgi:ABC-type glycerol-3-phosphate transport system substrate-binding protein